MTTQELNKQGGIIILNPVQIADEEIYDNVMDIIESDSDFRTGEQFVSFNESVPNSFIMQAVHSRENPILIDEKRIALLWCDRDDPQNPDLMVALILELTEKPDGSFAKKPCGIIAGQDFQGVLQYRCPCCGDNQTGFSMMFFVKNEEGDTEFTTRDALVTETGKRKLFETLEQGIIVSSAQISHILHHHNNMGQPCGHNHSHLPSGRKLVLK